MGGYPGGVVPYESGGRGRGFVRVGTRAQNRAAQGERERAGGVVPYEKGYRGGFVRVGPRPAPAPAPPWEPPPGSYDPARDINIGQGKETLTNTLADIAKGRVRGESDYTINKGELDRQRTEGGEQRDKALKTLADSFARLQGRQEEGAASAGVLGGGALAAAAARRGVNEGTQEGNIQTGFKHSDEALVRALGRLSEGYQRQGQDFGTEQERAEHGEQAFRLGEEKLKGYEATTLHHVHPPAPLPKKHRR